ncbi:MAG: penicillin-binding protein 2 [Nitrospinae bacterium]|nr:penicillin-binding protein 2 [Nitrospinota bacterium]
MRKNGKSRPRNAAEKRVRWTRVRAGGVFVLLALWLAVAGVRLVQLTLFSDTRVAAFSSRQGTGEIEVDLPRGMIYDNQFHELAVSIEMESVYLNPRVAGDPVAVAARLASVMATKGSREERALFRDLKRRIGKYRDKSFVWISRKAEPKVVAALRKSGIDGLGFVAESKRYYPKRDIAARLIGFCGIDNQGLYGLEYNYDAAIRPVASRFTVLRDALGRSLPMPEAFEIAEEAQPADLVLTLDERIQYITETALARQVAATGAKRGVAIVMDPYTGRIVAIGEQPKFNGNNFGAYSNQWWRSMAVSGVVEPGSTFKLITVAAALEEGLVAPDETIDCEMGRYQVGRHTFKEAKQKRYGLMTVQEVLEKSSNIGAIKIAERLGPDKLAEYLARFGFGEKTGVDLPGEATGLLRPVKKWSATSLPSISFGQEVGVTPLQLTSAVAAVANGGWLMRPRLALGFARGKTLVDEIKPQAIRRVISARTAAQLTGMMRTVVADGTGGAAKVEGFAVAGKTGTAQKIDPATGGYSEEKFLSSFAGFFPADRPRLVIVVMIDEPKGVSWGGAVAGPVFSEIADRAARILRIPTDRTEVYEIDWNRIAGGDAV